MRDKIRVGVIGVGGISNEHINAYLKNSNVELCAFCDINEVQLEKMGEKYGIIKLYTDMEEMFKVENLDAVSICTWNSDHATCSIAALNAGINVLCEKPMATSVEEAIAMKEAAEKNDKLLMIGFVRRFGNDCAILKEFMDVDYFGEIYYSKATYLRRMGNPGGWFGDKSRSGGGPLIDLGVHVIDFVRYVLGNPKPISVYGATFQKLFDRKNLKDEIQYSSASKTDNDICDVEDLASAMIRFDNGAVLSVEASFSLNIKKEEGKIELFGTKAGAKIDPELEIYTEINNYMADVNLKTNTALNFEGLFANEINHFVSCINDGKTCIAPAEDGIELMRILDAVYKSAKIGHEVILE